MSYAIINHIKIDDGKVMIKSADNNVVPRTPREWECKSLSELLQKDGKLAVEIAIMKDYESGNFQGGKNKYTRALEVLRHMPEYHAFDWRLDGKEYEEAQKLRKTEAFDELMMQALNTPLPKEKYAIIKKINGHDAYFVHRKGAHSCKWYYEPLKATLFSYREDAESAKKWFTNSASWEVIQVK